MKTHNYFSGKAVATSVHGGVLISTRNGSQMFFNENRHVCSFTSLFASSVYSLESEFNLCLRAYTKLRNDTINYRDLSLSEDF